VASAVTRRRQPWASAAAKRRPTRVATAAQQSHLNALFLIEPESCHLFTVERENLSVERENLSKTHCDFTSSY